MTYKDLCLDVGDLRPAAEFWAATLGLEVQDEPDGGCHLVGPTPQHTVWPCPVPERKTVKNRAHLDVHAAVPVPAGTTALSEPGRLPWQVVAGPEGDEICVFVRDEVPDYRLYEIVVDVVDAHAAARWWHGLWGGVLELEDDGSASVEDVPDVPFECFVFVPSTEPKTVKNRVHWDVTLADGASVQDLVDAGASVLRRPDHEVGWTVMTDPEGHEFCVFEKAA